MQPLAPVPRNAHDACAVGVSIMQSANAPRQRRVWWHERGVAENSGDRVVDCHALAAADEVNVEANPCAWRHWSNKTAASRSLLSTLCKWNGQNVTEVGGLLRRACGACLGRPASPDPGGLCHGALHYRNFGSIQQECVGVERDASPSPSPFHSPFQNLGQCRIEGLGEPCKHGTTTDDFLAETA